MRLAFYTITPYSKMTSKIFMYVFFFTMWPNIYGIAHLDFPHGFLTKVSSSGAEPAVSISYLLQSASLIRRPCLPTRPIMSGVQSFMSGGN